MKKEDIGKQKIIKMFRKGSKMECLSICKEETELQIQDREKNRF